MRSEGVTEKLTLPQVYLETSNFAWWDEGKLEIHFSFFIFLS